MELLKTLLTSAKCPPTVLALAAPFVLRVFPEPVPSQSKNGTENFDIKPIRDRALQAIGASTAIDGQLTAIQLLSMTHDLVQSNNTLT